MRIEFLGAARQVTGSCYHVECDGTQLLVDCGMFQGRDCQACNWSPTPVDVAALDAVLLTHGHLDHCGRLPRLVREGFRGRIVATEPTTEIASLIMEDSARLQLEDVSQKRKRHAAEGRRSPYPYEPLYTQEDVKRTVARLQGVRYDERVQLGDGCSARFLDAGHILGSAMIEITGRAGSRRLLFSGDMGQPGRPIVNDPTPVETADYVVLESTYGMRDHERTEDIEVQLAEIVNETVRRGGNVIIPTFAIERAQEVLVHLGSAIRDKRMAGLPVFLDSPMAVDVLQIYRKYPQYMDGGMRQTMDSAWLRDIAGRWLHLVRSADDSKKINARSGSSIIMAGSGMCTGGRIKHHLAHHIGRPGSTIVFVGYQAVGTLGRQIVDGAGEVRIFGTMHPVRSQVRQIQGLSAHAGRSDLLAWLGHFQKPPRRLIVTHGEEEAALALAAEVRRRMGWDVAVPSQFDAMTLD
jgi:metallo-beta-lactamase family protein